MHGLNCTACHLDDTFTEPKPKAGREKYYFIYSFV